MGGVVAEIGTCNNPGHGGHHHSNNDCDRKFVEIVEGEAISIVDVLSLTH